MCSQPHGDCLSILKAVAALLVALVVTGASGRALALDAGEMQAMVIVNGDLGRGSAFVVRMEGKTFLVTNSHVVRGNQNVKFKSLSNAELATGPLEIADNVDAVRAEVTGVANALELEPHCERIRIGDAVIVAGNSEGEGVVREIPGKVVGIGPDRIEVDAAFVPGNSGSPILLKSTGKVIGVATYMKVPRGLAVGAKSPISLNEVRRFGYRLDTVAKWIRPPVKDRLFAEGLKLAEMESLMSSITAVLASNASFVTKWGASSFVNKEKTQQYRALNVLSLAIDDFVKAQKDAKTDEDRAKNATAFFARLKGIVADDVRGMNENQFSGYYSIQLKESLDRCKSFSEWCDGTMMPAYRDAWVSAQNIPMFANLRRSNAPPIDPDKVKLVLSDHIVPNEPPDYCHHVTYPAETQPANLENIFWIVEEPKGQRKTFAMHKTGLRVRTLANGTYRVYVEYHGPDKPRVISNIAEVKITDIAAADGDDGGGAPPKPALPRKDAPVAPDSPAEKPAAPAVNGADAAKSPGSRTGAAPAASAKPLAEFLAGTKWLWYGRKKNVMEFRKDGKVDFDDWTKKGLVTAWEVSGSNHIKLTVVSEHRKGSSALLEFSDDRSSFSGIDFDGHSTIAKSPRAEAAAE